MNKNTSAGQWRDLAVAGLLGGAVTLALSAAALTAFAGLVASGRVGEGAQQTAVTVAAFLSALAGSLIARKRCAGAALLTGAATAVTAVTVRLVLMLAMGGGAFDGLDTAVILAMLAAGLISGALRPGKKRRRR